MTRPIGFLILLLLSVPTHAWADESGFSLELQCGDLASLSNAYGPFDYTNPSHFAENLPVVERYHFSPDVEQLVQGMTGPLIGDLDYVLRAFPNHHRALNAVGRLALRDGPQATIRPVECYFERAAIFSPDDATVYVVYGIYLYSAGKLNAAIAKLSTAVQLAPESAEANYNLGLVLYEDGQYRPASEYAEKALKLGYPLSGLMRKLDAVGYWPPGTESKDRTASIEQSP